MQNFISAVKNFFNTAKKKVQGLFKTVKPVVAPVVTKIYTTAVSVCDGIVREFKSDPFVFMLCVVTGCSIGMNFGQYATNYYLREDLSRAEGFMKRVTGALGDVEHFYIRDYVSEEGDSRVVLLANEAAYQDIRQASNEDEES